jgi:hypothetical protein
MITNGNDGRRMPSKRSVGIAPLVTGIVLTSQSLGQLLEPGSSLWAGAGFIGGLAAILVGVGILLQWGDFATESPEAIDRPVAILAGIALVSFLVGAAVTVV